MDENLAARNEMLEQLASIRRTPPLEHVHPDHEVDLYASRGCETDLLPKAIQRAAYAVAVLEHAPVTLALPLQPAVSILRVQGSQGLRPLVRGQQQQRLSAVPKPCPVARDRSR